jgi:hypothetical protein
MNVTINIVELASELASFELEENWGDTIVLWEEDEDEIRYTEVAQDVFNDLYEKYYSLIENYKIK